MLLDISTLLAPITPEVACGADMRLESDFNHPYYQLKNLRLQARQNERQRIQNSEQAIFNASEWQSIEQLGLELLQTKTKDLEITSWIIEAWLRMHNIAGLKQGLEFLTGLVETFKQQLHPQPSNDDPDCQLAAVQGLIGSLQPGTLIIPLLSQTITQSMGSDNYAVWQYQQVKEQSKKKDNNATSTIDMAAIQQAAQTTSLGFSTPLLEIVAATLQALQHCEEQFKQYFDSAVPNWSFLREALLTTQEALQYLYPQKTGTDASLENDVKQVERAKVVEHESSRETILKTITEASNYFLKHEPHSPIAYLLHQAVRWSQMSLPELTYEILAGSDAYGAYCKMVGLPIVNSSQQHDGLNIERHNSSDTGNYDS